MSTTKTCTIRVSTLTRKYYLGLGACRGNAEFKTFGGAQRAANRKGYVCLTSVDPMVLYQADEKRTKIVTNLISGKLVRIPVNTPLCCDPSSETYWSM